jgi:hypothetical protein
VAKLSLLSQSSTILKRSLVFTLAISLALELKEHLARSMEGVFRHCSLRTVIKRNTINSCIKKTHTRCVLNRLYVSTSFTHINVYCKDFAQFCINSKEFKNIVLVVLAPHFWQSLVSHITYFDYVQTLCMVETEST